MDIYTITLQEVGVNTTKVKEAQGRRSPRILASEVEKSSDVLICCQLITTVSQTIPGKAGEIFSLL